MSAENGAVFEQMIQCEITSETTESIAVKSSSEV